MAKRKAEADSGEGAKKAKPSAEKAGKAATGKTTPTIACLAPTEAAKMPSSSKEFRERLASQKKELYKDPPVLPPAGAQVLSKLEPLPTRSKDTGELKFADQPKFRPNLTPKEVMQAGSFGGTYFRPIVSAVTGERYRGIHKEFPADWFEGLDLSRHVVSSKYDASVNKYKVSCGGSLDMWESSGWISHIDPYGWFHWYCRFYLGRRSTDDARQIDRWLKGQGPTGRWRTQLCNKVLQSKSKQFDDALVSPVIRQTCLHWAYELTSKDLAAHARKKGIQL